MSSKPLLGYAVPVQDETDSLRRENRRLKEELEEVRSDLARERQKSVVVMRAMGTLRGVLQPLYNGLRAIYGELDVAGVGETASQGAASAPRTAAVWESWKQKLGRGTAKVIDALLLHGEMNTTQLSIATGMHRTTIPALIFKLNKASLLNKNGGKFSLKEL